MARSRPTLAAGLCLCALALLLPGTAPRLLADAGEGPSRGAAPMDNPSHVHDDDPFVREAFERAAQAEAEGRADEAAERLQSVVDQRFADAAQRECVPFVVAVDGRATYEGAWLVARHRLAGGSPALRAAHERRFGGPARELLARAVTALDRDLLAEVARRFLPLDEGRAAALALADLALEQGDPDTAFARLEALEDLEEVAAADDTARVERWRAARIAREARALARTPSDVPEVARHLLEAARQGPGAAARHDAVPEALRRLPQRPSTWPTTGGTPARDGAAPALPGRLRPAASAALQPDAEERALAREAEAARPDRPSPWVTPRVVVGRDTVFCFDGELLSAYGRADGRLKHRVRVRGEGEARPALGQDPREELPLLEGHALTLDEVPGRPARIYLASATRTLRALRREASAFGDSGAAEPPWGELLMVRWDGERLLKGWRATGFGSAPRLPQALAVFGAPCLHMGLLWIAGVRPSQATSDEVECWLVGLDPATGEPLRLVRLGSGSPWRLKRLDEAIPSSPAAAHGRVVVATSLGWVAAVDAEDGRVAWVQRYDRTREVGRLTRLNAMEADLTPRLTGFANEPPLVAFGLTVVAPTDSHQLLGLGTRPRGAGRHLVRWDPRDRRNHFDRMAVEALVGACGGDGKVPPTIVVTGKGDAGEGEPPGRVVAGLDPASGATRWSIAPATGHQPSTWGRAALSASHAWVPTLHGLLAVDLERGRAVELLGRGLLPPGQAEPEARWYGSLVPLPGEGLVAVHEGHITFWRVER
ncbi:MAG: PQQ-binding-like beta-propeller repeat protein [Planctomycetia bacterium]